MKKIILIFVIVISAITLNAQTGVSDVNFTPQSKLSDSLSIKKIPITKENFTQITSKKVATVVIPISAPAKLPTSGLEAYERLLKYYESEKAKAINQGLSTDEIDSNIAQLKEKSTFEKNKNSTKEISSDRPKFIDTGNYELDTKAYNDAKKEWIKNHPEEYLRITEPQQNTNESKILK